VREKAFLRLLETPVLRYLGKISYGMYVYHFPLIWFVARIRDFGLTEEIAKPLTLLIAAILVPLVASVSYRWLEKPILDQKDRFFSLKENHAA
jgi:peptidoglycan/LPS O-acetylase OafA/YrhL